MLYVIIMLISKRLGINIKKIRTIKEMSQGDICRALDMDRGYMSAIENGKKNITIQQLERLAQALGVSVDKLLK
jgi:transcriptional regulator with XRE-family HTH domain